MPKAPCRARFRTVVDLRASRRWRFRYVLDGERWENDWAADDYLPNSHGGPVTDKHLLIEEWARVRFSRGGSPRVPP